MRTLFSMAMLLLLAASCNKEVEEVLLPPVDIFPNPCRGFCQITLVPGIPIAGDATLYAPDGTELTRLTLQPGQIYAFALEDEGVYVLEVDLGGEIYAASLINTRP